MSGTRRRKGISMHFDTISATFGALAAGFRAMSRELELSLIHQERRSSLEISGTAECVRQQLDMQFRRQSSGSFEAPAPIHSLAPWIRASSSPFELDSSIFCQILAWF